MARMLKTPYILSVLAKFHSVLNSDDSAPSICPKKIGSDADTPLDNRRKINPIK